MAFRGLSVITAAAALVLSAAPAFAFTVDGKVSADDNYTTSYDLDFYVWNTNNGAGGNQRVQGGKLRVGRDGPSGDMYMMVEIPTSIVDNVYGDAADTAGSGWTQGHPFNDLRYSDQFEFAIKSDCSDKVMQVDYLNSQTNQANITRNDSGYLLDAASSLEYNLANGYGDAQSSPDPIAGTPPAGWIQTVQYEFKLKGEKFETGSTIGLADLSWAWLHASPNKLNGYKDIKLKCLYYNNCELSTSQSEPPPVALSAPSGSIIFAIATGILGMAQRRNRKRRSAAKA